MQARTRALFVAALSLIYHIFTYCIPCALGGVPVYYELLFAWCLNSGHSGRYSRMDPTRLALPKLTYVLNHNIVLYSVTIDY